MKAAFLLPPEVMPRPLDPERYLEDQRGLSGSEGSCIGYALGLRERGHEVALYCNVAAPSEIAQGEDRLPVYPYAQWGKDRQQAWDAALSWMSAEPLRGTNAKVRCLDQQYGDFLRTDWPWEASVDRVLCLSRAQARVLKAQAPEVPTDAWRLMPNGVDPEVFKPARKVPGRMVWLSSHDRGLHHLLGIWGGVRAALPHAELHVYYDPSGMQYWAQYSGGGGREAELRRRSQFCLEAFERYRGRGVYLHGTASRREVAQALATAELMPYPCDPITFTETFGVSVLEAMSAECLPLLCAADALPELWCGPAPSIPWPYPGGETYLTSVLELMQDRKLREEVAGLCRQHALRYRWGPLVTALEDFLRSGGLVGLETT